MAVVISGVSDLMVGEEICAPIESQVTSRHLTVSFCAHPPLCCTAGREASKREGKRRMLSLPCIVSAVSSHSLDAT